MYQDARFYHLTAQSIAMGEGYSFAEPGTDGAEKPHPTAFFPPGYPYFLGSVYFVFGREVASGRWANVVLGALTVLPAYYIATRFFSARVGLASALLVAATPALIFWTSSLLADTLFTLLVTTDMALLLRARVRERIDMWFVLAAGLVLGLAALVRGQALFLIPCAIVWLALFSPKAQLLKGAALLCLSVVLVILPWTVRNALEMNQFVFISTNTGLNFRIGHAPYSDGTLTVTTREFVLADSPNLYEFERYRNEEGLRRGLDYLVTHPLREIELSVRKVYWLWLPSTSALVWAESRGLRP